MKHHSTLAITIASLLTACADRGGTANGNAPQPEAVATATAPARPAGDRGRLGALSAADVAEAGLSGELACSFADASGAAMFHAAGDVGSSRVAEGLIKLGGTVAHVTAPGGYDRMARGTTFASPVTKVRIWDVGTPDSEGESPPRPATLTWTAGDGTQGSVTGRWTCGP